MPGRRTLKYAVAPPLFAEAERRQTTQRRSAIPATGVPLDRQRDRDPDRVSIRSHETLFERDFGKAAEQQRADLAFVFGTIVRMREIA